MNELTQLRNEVKQWAFTNLLTVKIWRVELLNEIEFTTTGIKDAINSPHEHYTEKLNAIYKLEEYLLKAEYIGAFEDIKDNKMVKQYHYFKQTENNIVFYFVIRELVNNKCYFYSITDKIKNR